jgi:hypothetical protein
MKSWNLMTPRGRQQLENLQTVARVPLVCWMLLALTRQDLAARFWLLERTVSQDFCGQFQDANSRNKCTDNLNVRVT